MDKKPRDEKQILEEKILELIKQYNAKTHDEILVVSYYTTPKGPIYYVRTESERR